MATVEMTRSSSGNQNLGRSRSSAKAVDGAVARATVRAMLFMEDLLPRKLVGILVDPLSRRYLCMNRWISSVRPVSIFASALLVANAVEGPGRQNADHQDQKRQPRY